MKKHDREPIGHTCPDIDKMIGKIEVLKKHYRNAQQDDDAEYLHGAVEDCLELLGIVSSFLDDDMRRANDILRNWGQQEAEDCDALEAEIEMLRDSQ